MNLHWRPMIIDDLSQVCNLAEIIHPGFPEGFSVFEERLHLYPSGCKTFERDGIGKGYLISHPWIYGQIPPLDSLLGELPQQPTTYYLHDLALLPETRGSGAAKACVTALLAQLNGTSFETLTLVSVNCSRPFWEKFGLYHIQEPALDDKLRSYSDDAYFMVKQLRQS